MDQSGTRTVRALVLEGEGKPALAAVRSLGRAGCEVDVVATGPSAMSFASRYCRERFLEPSIRDPDTWREFLLERVKAKRYDALLLMGQSSADCVGEHRHLFDPHVRILLPDPEHFRIARDKALTVRFAEKVGVPTPRTAFPADMSALSDSVRDLGYPLVVKGPLGSGSARVRYASSPEELKERFAEIARLGAAEGSGPPIIQELIRGEGLCYSGLFREGRPLAEFMWRRLHEYTASGGPTASGESICDDRLRELGRTMIAELRWTGAAQVEFKRDGRDGIPRIIEINPRFFGALELAIRSGVDLPRLYVEACLDRPFEPVLNYAVGRRLAFLHDRVLLGLSTAREWPAFLRELARPDRFDVDWGDLAPTLREMRATYWDYRALRRTARAPQRPDRIGTVATRAKRAP